jgi:WD40 repeat protein
LTAPCGCWTLDTGKEVFTIFAHPSLVDHAVFSHDGNKIASGSYDHTVRIWDATPLEGDPQAGSLRHAHGAQALVSGVAFSPGQPLARLGQLGRHRESLGSLPAERELGTRQNDGAIALRYTLRGHSGHVRSVAFSADNRTLASGSWDKTVKLWDLQAPVGDSLAELKTIPCAEPVIADRAQSGRPATRHRPVQRDQVYDPAADKDVAPFKRTPLPCQPGVHPGRPASDFVRRFRSHDQVGSVAGDKPRFEIPHYSNACLRPSVPDGRLSRRPAARGGGRTRR